MKKPIHPHRCWSIVAAILLTLVSASLQAAPRVVVSVAPLHSLVAALMKGVAEPELLFEEGDSLDTLTPAQRQRLANADVVLWVGPELETALAATLGHAVHGDHGNHAMAVTHHIPLFSHTDTATGKQTRNLHFWLDPRLAAMVVHHLAPDLVRLDPEHYEIYLDNEIELKARLRDAEQQARARLEPYQSLSLAADVETYRYFAHRFGLHLVEAPTHYATTGAVAVGCPGLHVTAKQQHPGSADHYFRLLEAATDAAVACLKRDSLQVAQRPSAP